MNRFTPYSDGLGTTWGLKATHVVTEPHAGWSGRGVRIAILDSGIDLAHPAFGGRIVATKSFVSGTTVQDVIGHGTHCAGTAAGFRDAKAYRYGVAFEAELCIGRVFGDDGGADADRVVAAIDWAVSLACDVIALPLGTFDAAHSDAFEQAGQRALAADCLAIAAAGNGRMKLVSQPANAASILAVGAVDCCLRLAAFSPGASITEAGPCVDLVAPGVDVYATAPGGEYVRCSGTSMAAAHVAGIAALWAEAEGVRGRALWNKLVESARPLPDEPSDSRALVLATAPVDHRPHLATS